MKLFLIIVLSLIFINDSFCQDYKKLYLKLKKENEVLKSEISRLKALKASNLLEQNIYFDNNVKKYGIRNGFGDILLQPEYDELVKGNNHTFLFSKGEVSGVIDENINIIFQGEYDRLDNFYDGYARCQIGDFWTHINKKGEFLLDPLFREVTNFENGYAYGKIDDCLLLKFNESGIVVDTLDFNVNSQRYKTRQRSFLPEYLSNHNSFYDYLQKEFIDRSRENIAFSNSPFCNEDYGCDAEMFSTVGKVSVRLLVGFETFNCQILLPNANFEDMIEFAKSVYSNEKTKINKLNNNEVVVSLDIDSFHIIKHENNLIEINVTQGP